MPLPDDGADLWLRRNAAEVTDEDGGVSYEADEAYMRTDASEAEILADLDTCWEVAAAWQPAKIEKAVKLSQEEEIASLKEQLANTMAAVDYLLLGGANNG